MKFQRRKIAAALAYTMGVGGALTVAATPAQAADIKVEVTGSNIKRVEGEGALPVQTITREEITRSGLQTAFEILDRLSAGMSFNAYNETLALGDSARPGFAGISMRGLGSDHTLVLLNGRRIANYSLAGSAPAVDLNAIPTSAIERVEILKDGASAIYGTDAIAGVINFITRKDFSGAEIFAYYGQPSDTGGEQARGTVSAGWGDLSKDKVNAWITFDYLENKALKAADRGFSKTAYLPNLGSDRTSGNSFPANVAIPGVGTRNPSDPTPNAPSSVLSAVCSPPLSFPTRASPHQCRYDFSSQIDIIDPSTRYNTLGRVAWQINPDTQLFGEGSYSKNKFTFAVSQTPASGGTNTVDGTPLLLPASSPYYPLAWLQANYPSVVGQPLNVSLRTVAMGRRTNETTTEQTRGILGLKGVIKGWDYESAFNYNESKVSDAYTDGWFDQRIFWPLFNSGVINPFGPNTAEVQAQMNKAKVNQVVQSAKGTVKSIDFKASNDIMNLPAGPLGLAFGGEYRKEDINMFHADILSSGAIVGGSGAIPAVPPRDRTVGALFAEVNIPIVKTVEAQAAVRFDNYSDFGSTTNPKVSLRWQPNKQLLLRGSWNMGYHAPSLADLYQPTYLTNTQGNYDDPLRCPFTQLIDDCGAQFNKQQGGNPKLKAERSDQYSLGIVIEPADNVSMSVDYFHIEIRDNIGQQDEGTIAPEMSNVNSPSIVRGPKDPLFPNLPGPILYWVAPTTNFGKTLVSGYDVDFALRSPTTWMGQFSTHLNGTYFTEYRQLQEDGSFPSFVGGRATFGSLPRWRHTVTFDWIYGSWNATVIENYTHSYLEDCFAGDSTGCNQRKVAAYETWDLSTGYQGFKNTTLRLGVKNILNRDPPVSNQNGTFQVGYDPTYADPRGRTYYGSVRYAFK